MNGPWARAYTPARGRWLIIGWEAFGLAYLHWAAVRYFDLLDPAGLILAAALALVWAVGSWRVVCMGLYVASSALRIRGVFRTRVVPFASLDSVVVEDVVYRAGPWRIPAGKSAVLLLRDGGRLNTAMWEQGLDFHRRPQLFRSVCQDLRKLAGSPG